MEKFSVTRNGEELHPGLYTWDEKTKTFSTNEDDLVLDFNTWDEVTFKTGDGCTFRTGDCCTFDTGDGCTFDTGDGCTFDTGWSCTFKTGEYCTFNTDVDCTFKTGGHCIFITDWGCTFNTGEYCTFNTDWECTFKTGVKCIIIDRLNDEVIRLNNEENYYDMNEESVTFEDVTVFRNDKGLDYVLHVRGLDNIKKFLSEEQFLLLQREVFDKLV